MHSDEWTAGVGGTGPDDGRLPAVGTQLGPWALELRAAANDRYWEGAGIDHPARRAGVLYPPLAANLLIVALQRICDEPLLHLGQRLRTRAAATAPARLRVTGSVRRRWEHRGREHLEIAAEVVVQDVAGVAGGVAGQARTGVVDEVVDGAHGPGTLLWEASAHFCTVRRRPAPGGARVSRGGDGSATDGGTGDAQVRDAAAERAGAAGGVEVRQRSLQLGLDLLRAYSRRGNFHSEPEIAARLGYPAPVAQGMQVAAPAYGLLLDVWGETLLRDAEVTWAFHRPVLAGQTVDARVHLGADTASFTVRLAGEAGTPGANGPAVTGRARPHPDRPERP
jgi:hypothetical protein